RVSKRESERPRPSETSGFRGRGPRRVEKLDRPGRPAAGSDDLVHFNDAPGAFQNRGSEFRPGEMMAGATRSHPNPRGGDDFVTAPLPCMATLGPTADQTATEALESYQREVAIVDARLAREVTVQQKATALSDLCEQLRNDIGIRLTAGSSVA